MRNPTLATTAGAAIIVAALPPMQPAGRGQSNNARAFNVRQAACVNEVGLLLEFVEQMSSSTPTNGGGGGGGGSGGGSGGGGSDGGGGGGGMLMVAEAAMATRQQSQ